MSKAENKEGWEQSEFPILCEPCLGSNPYVRMTKQHYGDECRICQRPHTIFRWTPAPGEPYRKTEVCQICSRFRNVCQCCVLDLQFGLPAQVRDKALALKGLGPESDVNRQYFAQSAMERAKAEEGDVVGKKVIEAGKELVTRLPAGTDGEETEAQRKDGRFCTLYAKGECKRPEGTCPYLHILPTEEEYRRRRYLYRSANMKGGGAGAGRGRDALAPTPPTDPSVTSLFLPSLPGDTTEADVRSGMHAFGEIRSIQIIPGTDASTAPKNKSASSRPTCAFITYVDRQAAEAAMTECHLKGVDVGGEVAVRVVWSKPKPKGPSWDMKHRPQTSSTGPGRSGPRSGSASAPHPYSSAPPPPPPVGTGKSGRPRTLYHSQDPTMLGSTAKGRDPEGEDVGGK
ncbi:hypothetical protein BJ684DRAFT_8495 [Piptocephalis cylindrospora]|uniref:RRM domain-containing protein n=1 Tax=Piptocephalis cylindrospora TaxID=1907219 RepID=A0A4P9Y723_9FUNG|nr:hypothetical protein BJ684DRAFT_8495 [Piptocephalis cylindrospora]|eukprot:RKP14504.1 hypothetical protein BJ684DRAFT_8495 [Piptocephalis cylindrospora]